jgi:hypothetical protein
MKEATDTDPAEFYSLDDYPYVEEILNSRAQKNWVMKAAQVGLSEAAMTIALYEVDYHQRSVLYYFPTKVMANEFSKTRFNPAINMSPHLDRVVTTKTDDLKQVGNASLYIKGVNSEASLRGTSAGRLFFDELDAWTERQQYMAEERASGQKDGDKIVWGFSTPRFPNCGVHKQYQKSTQEHYFFNCPHCEERIELLWEDSVVICGDSVDDPEVYNSYLKCSKCQGKLPHDEKRHWLKAETRGGSGKWEATNPDADPTLARGFWVNQLYSPTIEPWEIVIAYLRGYGDEAGRREFHNSKLGLPFIEDAHQVTDAQIDEAIKKYSLAGTTLPFVEKDGIVTLGIDQGGPVHHWAAVKWMFDVNKVGDPNDRATGKLVGCGRILQDDWAGIHALMRTYQVWRCVIDYFPEPTSARVFARAFPDAVYLCQYVKGAAAREVRLTEDDYGAHIARVDKVSWLSKSLGRVMVGDIQLPLDLPLEFRKHLKAPVRTLKEVDGQYVAEFVETGPDHYAHALNYAEIALKILDPALNSSSILTNTRE